MSFRTAFDTFRGYRTPHFRIVQNRKRWFVLSGTVLALALAGLFVRGINYSIDFTGGSLIQYPNPAGATVEDVRGLLGRAPYDRGGAEIQLVAGDQLLIRTSAITVAGETSLPVSAYTPAVITTSWTIEAIAPIAIFHSNRNVM